MGWNHRCRGGEQQYSCSPPLLCLSMIFLCITSAHKCAYNCTRACPYTESFYSSYCCARSRTHKGIPEEVSNIWPAWRLPHSYPYALYTMGLIKRGKGDLVDSAVWLEQAQKVAQQNHDPYLEAYVWRALGETWAANQQPEEARGAYAQASTLFTEMGIEAEAAKTKALLAEVEGCTKLS